jgi:outer membrane protein assembly factor BamB
MDERRRRLLRLLGAGTLAGLAGCSGGDGDDEPTDGDDGESTTAPGTPAPTSTSAATTTGDGDPTTDEQTTDAETTTEAEDDDPAPTPTPGLDWPLAARTPRNETFRPDGASTSGDLAVDWHYAVEGTEDPLSTVYYSSPVVADGVAYTIVAGRLHRSGTTTSGDGSNQLLHEVVGVDVQTGDRTYSRAFREDADGYPNGVFTPAVVDGTLYFGVESLQAVDLATGDRRWQYSGGIPQGPTTVHDGLVAVPTYQGGSGVTALDATDGTRRWRWEGYHPQAMPPAVTAETVFVADGASLVALDRADGSERWRTNVGVYSERYNKDDASLTSPPVVGDDAVFAAGAIDQLASRDSGALVALDRESGTERWTFYPGDPEEGDAGIYGIPALHDGTLYVTGNPSVGYGDAHLFAVDAADGSERWRTSIPQVNGYVHGSGDAVLVASTDAVTAHATADGSERGRVAVDDRYPNLLSKAVVGGRILAAGIRGLTAVRFA